MTTPPQPSDHQKGGARDHLPPWPGDCFQRAGYEMLRNQKTPDIVLVHAQVPDSYNPGAWVDHAWCELPAVFTLVDEDTGRHWEEPGIVVIDNAQPDPNSRILPRDRFYEHCTPRNAKRYTFAQMIAQVMRYRHDGPWPD